MYEDIMESINERHKSFWDEFNKSQEQIQKNLAESENLQAEINKNFEGVCKYIDNYINGLV